MNKWYEVKIKYTKQMEDGRLKRVTELYLVDAVSHSEAEAIIYQEVIDKLQGEVIVKSIAEKSVHGIVKENIQDVQYGQWFEAKVSFMSIDGDSGNERRVKNNILVFAETLSHATETVNRYMRKNVSAGFEVVQVKGTAIEEIIMQKQEND